MNNTLIIGPAGSGKDKFAEFMGVPYKGGSDTAFDAFAAHALMTCLLGKPYKPQMEEAAWTTPESAEALTKFFLRQRKDEFRGFLYYAIRAFNSSDETNLAREVLKHGKLYVGMRSHQEAEACIKAHMFKTVILVQRPVPHDPTFKINIKQLKAKYNFDLIEIRNTGTLKDLREEAERVAYHLGYTDGD